MFNDDPYRNAVLSRSERLRAGRESTSEFDQIFESMNAPDYPATCDRCGMEGTNASMENHACNEAPAPRAGESDEWEYRETRYGAEARAGQFAIRLHWTGLADISNTRATISKIVTEHNQHAALIEQRERLQERFDAEHELLAKVVSERNELREQREQLTKMLKRFVSPAQCYCHTLLYGKESRKCGQCEARELIATIEREEVQ